MPGFNFSRKTPLFGSVTRHPPIDFFKTSSTLQSFFTFYPMAPGKKLVGMFIKFGKKEHLLDLQKNGTIFTQPLKNYAAIEDEDLRGDKHEGIARLLQANKIKIRIDQGNNTFWLTPESGLTGFSTIRFDETQETNIYCMYCILNDFKQLPISDKNLRFGKHALCINAKSFFKRIYNAAEKERIDIKGRVVEYIDEKEYHGEMSIFKKRSCFSYQNEYRLAFSMPYKGAPKKFVIGDISDISTLVKSGELNDIIEVKEHP